MKLGMYKLNFIVRLFAVKDFGFFFLYIFFNWNFHLVCIILLQYLLAGIEEMIMVLSRLMVWMVISFLRITV